MFPLKIAEKVSQELRNFVFTREFILAWDLINADSMNVTKHFIGGKPGRGMKHGIPKRWEHFYRHWWERIHEDIFTRISANGSIKAHTSKFLQDIYTWIDPNWWHNSTSFFFMKWLIENTSSTSWEDACMWCLFKSIHFRIQTEDTSTYAYWGTSLLVPVISFLNFFQDLHNWDAIYHKKKS